MLCFRICCGELCWAGGVLPGLKTRLCVNDGNLIIEYLNLIGVRIVHVLGVGHTQQQLEDVV